MLRKSYISLALAGCMFLILPHAVQAKTGIMNDWQAHYNPCAILVAADCSACHTGGFGYNSYGEALRVRIADLNLTNVEAFIDAENLDSDGDGYSNGQEIVVDCTLPYDDTSHGTVAVTTSTWGHIKGLFR